MGEVHGSCDPAFDSLRGLLQQRLLEGAELGVSLCVNVDGRNVLDLWGGYEDANKTKPWSRDTITGIWSATKVITCLAAHLLVDRGRLDLNERVATYWPEFAANGKENVKVWHLLAHSSGLPAWEIPITLEVMQDGAKLTQRLADQAPWFVPGSHSGYQVTNHGHLVGEVVRRITGKSLTQFVDEEIAKPLRADIQLGLPEDDWPRTAEIVPFLPEDEIPQIDPASMKFRAFSGSSLIPTLPNEPVFRKVENGAIGGFSNARGLARMGSMVSLNGTVDGKQYFTPQTLDEMTRERFGGKDLVLESDVRFTLGLTLPAGIIPSIPNDDGVCFWGGWGGSMVLMDRRRRMTVGYVMNKMPAGGRQIGNKNFDLYIREIHKSFKRLPSSSASM